MGSSSTLIGAAVLFLGAASFATVSFVPAGFAPIRNHKEKFFTAGFLLCMLGMLMLAGTTPQ